MDGRGKVFCIGGWKTGTVSLHKLFLQMGLRSFHYHAWPDWVRRGKTYKLYDIDCFLDGGYQNPSFLDSKFPGCKFILTVRSLRDTLISRLAGVLKKAEKNHRRGKKFHPPTTWDTTQYAVTHWILERNKYHEDSLLYERQNPARLLVVNFVEDDEAVSKISNFLGYSDEFDKPWHNKSLETFKQQAEGYSRLIDKAFADVGANPADAGKDILCRTKYSGYEELTLSTDSFK